MVNKKMSERPPTKGMSGGGNVDVGALMNRIPMTARTGAIVMKSVSIFLTSGRKASVNCKKTTSDIKQRDKRRKMPDEANMKAYHAKVVESLRKVTRFSRPELEALCKIYKKLTTAPSQKSGTIKLTKCTSQIIQTVEVIIIFI